MSFTDNLIESADLFKCSKVKYLGINFLGYFKYFKYCSAAV
jgi:hypothetical protein